ncbi:unnamed protein product [Musa acuminata subsp. malaccensis]|uniref:(wild Malaysian banana) hypothetical protein n=1 Tax=Musa acuminata subsp. malaccensis TaxID=214687 RepID=A0A8D7B2U0_MUSAM|nr:unnamed protein product [Musa acuminata subsp. malaccensis]
MDLLSLPAGGSVAAATTTSSALALLPPNPVLVATKLAVSFSNKLAARRAVVVRTAISVRASFPSQAEATASGSLWSSTPRTRWMVVMERPPGGGSSKPEVIDYYVETLASVLGSSEKEAQMCIYDASWRSQYGFCCDIDEESSRELARMPGVLSVRPDTNEGYGKKNYSYLDQLPADQMKTDGHTRIFPSSIGKNEHWLVRIEKPGVEVVTKAQMVDYYAQTLTKVLGNEKDAQVCIYHISWEKDFGFCCHIDEEYARELADVPGVLSVQPDMNFESENKNYNGNDPDLSETNEVQKIRTKRLFVTGLSFYTSEKTLRAAFEGFGELVEVKIIMDKISKRSKGYAFIEYTTEEAASAALKEMNGKIINGWMIVVDVARTNPPKYSRGHPRPSSSSVSSN